MPRHTWTPETDEQRAALNAIEQAADKADAADAAVLQAVEAARQAGVPMTHAVKKSRRSRATIYRHRARSG